MSIWGTKTCSRSFQLISTVLPFLRRRPVLSARSVATVLSNEHIRTRPDVRTFTSTSCSFLVKWIWLSSYCAANTRNIMLHDFPSVSQWCLQHVLLQDRICLRCLLLDILSHDLRQIRLWSDQIVTPCVWLADLMVHQRTTLFCTSCTVMPFDPVAVIKRLLLNESAKLSADRLAALLLLTSGVAATSQVEKEKMSSGRYVEGLPAFQMSSRSITHIC